MDSKDATDRLLLIARDRLRNRPGAFKQFQFTLERTMQGVALVAGAQAMPYAYAMGEEMGNPKAAELIREHLTSIVDFWAKSQPLPPAVDALPGAAPLPITDAREATPAPVVVEDVATKREPRQAIDAPKFSMTKAALIEAHEHEWESIRGDMKDASVNGLAAAKAGAREWWELAALDWARAKGKLKSADKPASVLAQNMHTMASIPGRKHTLKR